MMHRYHYLLLLVSLGFISIYNRASGQANTPSSTTLTVSNPYCAQVQTSPWICNINMAYANASSTDSSLQALQISVDGKTRVYVSTFFEPGVNFGTKMLGPGLQVVCGVPNASGVPGYGKIYNVGISALFTNSQPITDTANVTCPAYESRTYMPVVKH